MGVRRVTSAALAALLLSACGATQPETSGDPAPAPPASPTPTPSTAASPTPPPEAEPEPEPEPGTVPPPWLGQRELPLAATGFGEVRRTPPALRERRFTLPVDVEPLAGRGFASDVVTPPPARVLDRSTWEPGCPVAAEELSWVRLTFRGFDGERHTGELLTNAAVVEDLVQVFEELWEADFPLEELRVTRRDELDAAPTGDGNNSGSFVCRPVVGGTSFSQHAYGLAVDLNPFQNPYTRGQDVVLPELASAYLDREWRRPGMFDAGSAVVRAFDRIGWTWGGTWRTANDRHHFSLTGG